MAFFGSFFFFDTFVDCGAPGGGRRRPGVIDAARGAARGPRGALQLLLDYRKPGPIQPRSGAGRKGPTSEGSSDTSGDALPARRRRPALSGLP